MYINNNKNKNKDKKFSFRIDILILVCVLTFATCFSVYMFTNEVTTAMIDKNMTDENENIVSSGNNSNGKQIVNPVAISKKADKSYFDNTVFIGDTLTLGFTAYNFLLKDNVITSLDLNLSNVMTQTVQVNGEELSAVSALKKKGAENVYILFGSDGISMVQTNTLLNNYASFLDAVKNALPNAKIYVLSISPVTAGRESAANNAIFNKDIDEYNSKLLNIANDKNVYFVDANTALKNNKGLLDDSNAESDGLHINKNAYSILTDYILTHIAE